MEVESVGLIAGITFTEAHVSMSVRLFHADVIDHKQVDSDLRRTGSANDLIG